MSTTSEIESLRKQLKAATSEIQMQKDDYEQMHKEVMTMRIVQRQLRAAFELIDTIIN